MRTALVLIAIPLVMWAESSFAMNDVISSRLNIRDELCPSSPGTNVVWFGGDGGGHVVRNGVWNWETTTGEAPQYFPDGDPVGNQYRDGWTFQDRTARNGPSPTGAGHWSSSGIYDFNNDTGSFAHRATTHANNGSNDGPDPLQGGWSLWIGTNLYLNPEDCAWSRAAGYGDGWSQGFQKSFNVPAGSAGIQYDLRFYHRYACEVGFDTCRVEISTDGLSWLQVGDATAPNGIFNGGDRTHPQPSATGGLALVNLITWPSGQAGTLYVRLRLVADAFFSDSSEGGNFFWGWQIDDVELLRNGVLVGTRSTFETGMDGWQPQSFEGFDFAITASSRPAGRIERISNNQLACRPAPVCPEDCGLENRVLLFADRDDCNLSDSFQDSYATSPAFAITSPGRGGRSVQFDVYLDGGAGLFQTGPAICWSYWPYNASRCPFTPAAGNPGAGTTFNWSQTDFATSKFYDQGASAGCIDNVLLDLSSSLPATADSVILYFGVFSQCRSQPSDMSDNGAPFYDNIRFGVFPRSTGVGSDTIDRYTDNFPTSNNGVPLTATCRTDGAHSLTQNLTLERPLRWVRSDTAVAQCAAGSIAMFLRFAVERGPCQPNLTHPFFVVYPPSAPGTYPSGLIWHAARMDTAESPATSAGIPQRYMTCFHESDPRNNTFWTGVSPAVEPCDDILPDGLFTAGTNVYYFFEARNATSGTVVGTFPSGPANDLIYTGSSYRNYWLQINNLPEPAPLCDGTFANDILVVNDFQTGGVPSGLGMVHRERLMATLCALGLDFDVYDVVGTDWHGCYDGIGRREDRPTQQPRPPYNGATNLMLDRYGCAIWYSGGMLDSDVMLSDQRTLSLFMGQPSNDQQKLETWLAGCTVAHSRLLLFDGTGWAPAVDANTVNGSNFLSNRGIDILCSDYAQELASSDLRRCARIAASRPGDLFDHGEVFGSGCPENVNVAVFGAVNGGEAVAHFVESLEGGNDPINCADDLDRPAWLSVVRRRSSTAVCQHSASMSFAFAELYPLDCAAECQCGNYLSNGENAELLLDLLQWVGCLIPPTDVGAAGEPRLVNELYQAQPNPANPRAEIRYAIAQKGHVSLRIFDVEGRLVRTLVDEVQEPAVAPFVVVWDGTSDAGRRVGSGVFFYQIDTPTFESSRKLVILK